MAYIDLELRRKTNAARQKRWLAKPGNRQRSNLQKKAWADAQDPNKKKQWETDYVTRFRAGTGLLLPKDARDLFTVVPLVSLQSPRFIVSFPNGRRRFEGFQSAESLAKKLGPLLRMRKPLLELLRAAGHLA